MTRFRQVLFQAVLGAATLILMTAPFPLKAELPEAARLAYEHGDFRKAAENAAGAGTAQSLAYAARAVLAEAELNTPPEERAALIEEAVAYARAAVAMDEGLIEARLQLVAALGVQSRFHEGFDAHFAGLPAETRDHLDYILEREPDNALAHALYGCWHLIVRRKGGTFGSAIYGASVEKGVDYLERAMELDPDDALITYQYALQLAALRDEAHDARIETALARLRKMEADDAAETLVLARAADLELAMASGEEEEILPVLAAQLGQAPGEERERSPSLTPRGGRR